MIEFTRRSASSPGRLRRRRGGALFAAALLGLAAPLGGQDLPAPDRPDLLTFAAGVVPTQLGGSAVEIGLGFEHAVAAIDGNEVAQVYHRRFAGADTDMILTYALPASTTFDRFAVPNVLETPSPSQTFVRSVEVFGSGTGREDDYVLLASVVLAAHAQRGEVTEVPILQALPVRFVRIRLSGGLQEGATFLEFSELIGNGTQEAVPMATHFDGVWTTRGSDAGLAQRGPVVTGCVDRGRKSLEGTVTGNVLYATLTDLTSGVGGALVLTVTPEGALWGLRSDNGAPFALYTAEPAAADAVMPCAAVSPVPLLGCGSVIHGIRFDYNSARLLADATPVLDALYEGLLQQPDGAIGVVGHTSSEGTDAYNLQLSQARAQAVVDELVRRGVAPSRITSSGAGEATPIASNDTETGRALNRRVEIVCGDAP